MAIRLHDVFRWSGQTLLLSVVIFALCALVALLAPPRYMGLYDTATYQARIVLFLIPPAALLWIASGLRLYFGRKSAQKAGAENRLTRIMQQLDPDERDYLQTKLDERLVGLGQDGELQTLVDLLDDTPKNTSEANSGS